jgi:MerR family transcriptional regulator, thiopeptide resistance regulator
MSGFKIGDLAGRAGVSVRTLHYYDEIGLLVPSQKSAGGHRLYSPGDIARLQQIRSLRHLGLSLSEIADCLQRPEFTLRRVLAMHLERLTEQIDRQHDLRLRLSAVSAALATSRRPPLTELLAALEGIARSESYFTEEQRVHLANRARKLGEDRIRRSQVEWRDLLEEVRRARNSGADPKGLRVRRLAARWLSLVRDFTGGDPGIARGLQSMYERETSIHGNDTSEIRALWSFLGPAMKSQRAKPA